MHRLAKLDHQYVWHPFTQMRDWLKREPIILVEGKGALLWDVNGRSYLDANSSIWTNLHGHNHPRINAAIRRQLGKIAHSSALGFANEPATLLAQKLAHAANPLLDREPATRRTALAQIRVNASQRKALKAERLQPELSKVFFSDDGSTALEVALKLAFEFSRRSGRSSRPRFLSLDGAYHGDTVGAVSLGHIPLFHKAYKGLLFQTDRVMAPYCYRCPFNRAKPERADAREYRKCSWECLGKLEDKFAVQSKRRLPYSAFIFEPLIQGAAGMIPQPVGWLARAVKIARAHGALLIADEVMTGFGRTGTGETESGPSGDALASANIAAAKEVSCAPRSLFGSHAGGVQPDFLALAKGLTGGYVPMAATLTTQPVFEAFLGRYDEFKTFFHGHSFTGNQIGASAALASMEILETTACYRSRARLELTLREELKSLWCHPCVGDIRQVGLIAGVELVADWRTRKPLDIGKQVGIRVCESMARRGVLTRPIGNVIVLMPPYCTTKEQVHKIVAALTESLKEVL
jgi:adenosylmethionine-8-amino-7-oxononanoate aminotransferase